MFYHSCAVNFMEVPFSNATLDIYTVGCPHHCEGCHSVDLQNFEHPERQILTENILKENIEKSLPLIESICWLGGDPLYQFNDCIKFSCFIKDNYPQLINVVFTGYTFEDLCKDQEKKRLLYFGGIDFLIDGPWKGVVLQDSNCNQKIRYFNGQDFKILTYEEYKNFKN